MYGLSNPKCSIFTPEMTMEMNSLVITIVADFSCVTRLAIHLTWIDVFDRHPIDTESGAGKRLLCSIDNRRDARWYGSFIFLLWGLCKKFSTSISRVVVVDQSWSRSTRKPAFVTQADSFSAATKTMHRQIERRIRKTWIDIRGLDLWRRSGGRCSSRTKMSLWRRQRAYLWRQRQKWSAERAIQRRNKS